MPEQSHIAWKFLPTVAILALAGFVFLLVLLQRFSPRVQNLVRLLLLPVFVAIWIGLTLAVVFLAGGLR